jgi:hypothetical protein
MEDREVKSKTEFDGVAWGKSDLVSLVVSFKGLLLNLFHKISLSILSNIAIVVTDHLYKESL